MIKFIKDYFWYILGVIVVIAAAIFLKDLSRLEELKSFFRRKQVEEEVDELKRKIATENVSITMREEELIQLAEKLKQDRVNIDKATDKEIEDYYAKLFSK